MTHLGFVENVLSCQLKMNQSVGKKTCFEAPQHFYLYDLLTMSAISSSLADRIKKLNGPHMAPGS